MAPCEALYGRKCQFPLCWYETGESSLLGPELIAETTEQIKKIQNRILTAQSCQKSYADQRQKPLEFDEGDHVFLKVTPTTGVGRLNKTKKLNPFQLREDLTLPVTPIQIHDSSVKQLHRKEVALVKVAWSQAGIETHT
ncbi:uncharacterized protein LOC110271469 [Arachis ipaensis]|uniref:uncharacterized protein LOC110271469 n=1 Tax=Arachis ipaensis TaxID=130454 RepID=UPI000A2B830A|nr:uncharacterized protein LOC110271469 [Arachis ipaensis]XP_025647479.1 uncharacterized protein LOC112742459 [Arachis hypogaea]